MGEREDGGARARCSGARCCLLHSFLSTATSFPNKVAVIHAPYTPQLSHFQRIVDGVHVYEGDVLYTFKELQSAVEVLAALLKQKLEGDKLEVQGSSLSLSSQDPYRFPEVTEDHLPKRVAIIISHSAEYLVAILAVMKIFAAFVPVDPLWPSKRIIATLVDSGPSLLITSFKFTKLDAHGSTIFGQWPTISVPEGFIKASTLENQLCDMQHSLHLHKTRLFCYIMYTSGSSGKPKGVCGTEKGLLNRLMWMESAYPYTNNDVGCFKTPIAFIDHLTESLGPLIAGIPLIIPCHMVLRSDPLALLVFLKTYNITRLTAVPSLLRTLLPVLEAAEWRHAVKLSVLVSSGEALLLALWKSLQRVMPQTTILNLYGSTELAGDCTFYDCNEIDGSNSDQKTIVSDCIKGDVPIGKPISGCLFSIVTENGSLATLNEEGELWVGGAALAYGYLNDATANNKKFVDMLPSQTNPFCEKRSESDGAHDQVRNDIGCRMFRTGDIVRQRADGNIILVGRKDRMVKIYGQRVELREVEITLEQHPGVKKVAVLHCKLSNANVQLVAYVVPCGGSLDKPSENALKCSLVEWLNELLPSYMVPNEYIFLGILPLTASGKVNYSSLPKFFVAESCILEQPPKTLTENQELEKIMQIYADVLRLDHVSVSDDFFKLGGTSISAAHVAYVLKIDMNLIYKYPTPSALQSVLHVLNKRGSSVVHLEKWGHLSTQIEPILVEKADQNKKKSDHTLTREVNRSSKELDLVLLQSNNAERECLVEANSLQVDATIEVGRSNPCVRVQRTGKEDSHGKMLKRKCSPNHPFLDCVEEKHQRTWPAGLSLSGPAAFMRCNRSLRTEPSFGSPSRKSCRQISSGGKACSLQLNWHCSLDACIDASPLLVVLEETWRLYIGSHAHKFLCVDALSGDVRWGTQLGGRIESTAAVTQDFSQVVVGCYDGFIYFLDINTGNKVWSFQTDGEVKCQPTLDTWQGLIWCGSHDHNLYALNSTAQECTWQRHCEGSIFASPTIDAIRCTVYVAMTSGHILAVLSKASFHVQWVYSCGAPVFGSLALDPSSGQVFCTVVDGSVISLMPSGSLAWKVKIGGPVFAGACVSYVLPSMVLVCSRDGYLYCLDMVHGDYIWKISLSEPITAAAWIDEEMEVIGDVKSTFRLVCVCTAAGSLHVLKVRALLPDKNVGIHAKHALTTLSKVEPENVEIDSRVSHSLLESEYNCAIVLTRKLPSDIFSVPLMIGGRIFVGCRDDNLYCFDLSV